MRLNQSIPSFLNRINIISNRSNGTIARINIIIISLVNCLHITVVSEMPSPSTVNWKCKQLWTRILSYFVHSFIVFAATLTYVPLVRLNVIKIIATTCLSRTENINEKVNKKTIESLFKRTSYTEVATSAIYVRLLEITDGTKCCRKKTWQLSVSGDL